jgi:transcriptional regulator with XRE-family HTH domain
MGGLAMSFGSRLKTLRIEKRRSQRQIAEEFGISINCVSQYENDKRFPDEEMLVRLCKYYDISSDYLLGLSNTKRHIRYKEMQWYGLNPEQEELVEKFISMINEKTKEKNDDTSENL